MLVTRNFPPMVGGMEKLNHRLLQGLMKDREPILCGPSGSAAHVPPGVEVAESPLSPLPVFFWSALRAAISLARRRRPRWVIAGSGLTAPIAWLAARISGAGCAVYLHGLDVIAPHPVYRLLWLPFVRRCDLAIANSSNTAALAQSRGVLLHRLHVVNPGVDPIAGPRSEVSARVLWGIGHRPMLISVGRFTQRKGLEAFVREALPTIVAQVPGVILVVVGSDALQALHGARQGEQSRIAQAALEAGVENSVLFAGQCDQPTLESALESADCHVFPVLDLPGDVEGFGMVALEAASFGLPSVAFRVGGVPDAIEDGRTGQLVRSGDYAAFAAAVLDQLRMGKTGQTVADCRSFANARSWDAFSARIAAILDSQT